MLHNNAFKLKEIDEVEEGDSLSEVNTIYGDMMTFLMSLFILLFVLSYNSKDATFFTEMRVKFGAPKVEQDQVLTTESLFVSRLQGYLKKEKLDQQSSILVDEQKITLILDTPILYDLGKAELKSEGKKVLKDLAGIFGIVKNPIIIEGHTDNIPINTPKYGSNWELSFYRAYSVVKYFIHDFGFSPNQMSAIGYGEYHPLNPNDTAENRAKNRRIAINIIRVGPAESTLYSQ